MDRRRLRRRLAWVRAAVAGRFEAPPRKRRATQSRQARPEEALGRRQGTFEHAARRPRGEQTPLQSARRALARGWGPGRRRNERRRARTCHGAVLGRRRRPETRRQRRRGHPLACSSVARVHLHPRLRQQEGGRRRAIPRACGPWFGGCGPRQPQSRRRARGFGFPRMPSPGHDCSVAFRRREGRCCSNLSQAASGIAPPSAGRSLAVGAADKG